MIRMTNGIQKIAMTLGAAFAISGVAPLAANAQGSILHRHHKAAGAIGGYAAYRAAKRTGRNRMASGRHRNFMQRHPMLTGVGAAAITNHYAKKHQ